MILGFDHVIFLVAEAEGLEAAAEGFATMGFTITDRDDEGKPEAATAQKLICFADGSYIEILAIRDAKARQRHRFAHLLAMGDGWADHTVHTDDLEALRQRLEQQAMPFSGPHRHERRLRSGAPWGVSLLLPGIGAGHPALPFLLQDTAGRELRIPAEGIRHANGVTGTAGVAESVRDIEVAAPQFAALFGDGQALVPGLHGPVPGRRFAVGRHWLDVLEQPDDSGVEGMRSLFLTRPGADGTLWLGSGRQSLAVIAD